MIRGERLGGRGERLRGLRPGLLGLLICFGKGFYGLYILIFYGTRRSLECYC